MLILYFTAQVKDGTLFEYQKYLLNIPPKIISSINKVSINTKNVFVDLNILKIRNPNDETINDISSIDHRISEICSKFSKVNE